MKPIAVPTSLAPLDTDNFGGAVVVDEAAVPLTVPVGLGGGAIAAFSQGAGFGRESGFSPTPAHVEMVEPFHD